MSDELNKYYPEYERIMVNVYTENAEEKQKYFNLFNVMIGS